MSVLDKLDNASTGRQRVEMILDAKLDARWQALMRRLPDAAAADAELVVEGGQDGPSLALPATTKAVDDMDEIRDQVVASRVYFDFEPMDWQERLALQSVHPPRQGDLLDQARGYNALTFIPALIKAACVGVLDEDVDDVAPTPVPDAKWTNLLGDPTADPPVKPKLAYAQVSRLFAAAQETDKGLDRIPPSARSLIGIQDSGASLASPSPGTSPRSGSAGGSRRTSRKSSTRKTSATKKAASSGKAGSSGS